MVVVKRRQLGMTSRNNNNNNTSDSSSHISVIADHGKSPSASSLRGSSHKHHKPSSSVCFACDYGSPDDVSPTPPSLSYNEMEACFYTMDDLNRFDKDRALTVLLYRTRKSNGLPWDDNVHSLRGLEDVLHQSNNNKKNHEKTSRKDRRNDLVHAVLREQERLKSPSGQRELSAAALTIKKSERELYDELIRGVSCSMSRIDKQRAIGLALKDEKAIGRNRSSSLRMLSAFKTKLSNWISTSNGSLADSLAGNSCDSGSARPLDDSNCGCSAHPCPQMIG